MHVGRQWPIRVFLGARVEASGSGLIALGAGVRIDRDVWLHAEESARLAIGAGSAVGRRCTLSAAGTIVIGNDVLLGPDVLVVDHTHGRVGHELPYLAQDIVRRGSIFIEDGVWIGKGARIISGTAPLVIGKGALIGAGATIRASIPAGAAISAGGRTAR